ncbi:MAG: endonuclease [Bacteroidia bacterium]|nr:endonuclease [Bacteroidia bacterium]
MRFIILPLFFFLSITCSSQILEPATSRLVFPTASELDTLDRSLPIMNPTDFKVKVTEIRFYDTYLRRGFSAETDTFSLEPGQSKNIKLFFHPGQNVSHNSEMVLITEDGIGAFTVDLGGTGIFSNSYYSSTANLSEQALKDALQSRLASGQVTLSYNNARNAMFEEIDNQRLNGQGANTNTIECVYTGTVITGYANRTAAQNQNFNTEHTFPQSFFNQDIPMRSDLFHLFPTTSSSNSVRGNFPFGIVSNPGWQQGGSKQGNSTFEPRDEQKGRVARAMFYFVLRYQNYSNFLNSQEAILRQWHLNFLPSTIDKTRNEDIFSVQKNRNPFIDYPQFIHRISSISSNSTATRKSLDIIYNKVSFRDTPVDTSGQFSFVMVNDGELPVNITNISIQGAAFQLGFSNDTLIEAGEALSIPLIISNKQEGFYEGTLQFNTDVNGLGAVSIAVEGTLTGATSVKAENLAFSIYPIPAHDHLSVRSRKALSKDTELRLLDINGKSIPFKSLFDNPYLLTLDLSDVEPGIYILIIEGLGSQKFILE